MNTEYRDRQAPVPTGWEKIHDIRWFAENLNSGQFRALSTGLGLGALKPAGTRAQRAILPVSAPVFDAPTYPVMPFSGQPSAQVEKPNRRWQNKKDKSSRFDDGVQKAASADTTIVRSSYSRLLSAWVFDFGVVVLSLMVAFAVAVVLTMLKTGETDNWLALRPIKFLAARKPFEILASVYAIFALYMLVFKFGAGRTVGELIFLRKRAKTTQSVTS